MSVLIASPFRSLVPLALIAAAGLGVALSAMGAGSAVVFLAAALFVVADWLVSPLVVRWFVRPHLIAHDGHRYVAQPGSPEAVLGAITDRRCREVGLVPVRLGVADHPIPNAFTFGRRRSSAYVVVTTGLLEELSSVELDAVVCHELGHVQRRDALVMTLLAVVPITLWFLARWCMDHTDDDGDGLGELALPLFAAYLVTEALLLSFSRQRELAADAFACRHTGDGEALASALVRTTVAAGRYARAQQAADLPDARLARGEERLASVGALGFVNFHGHAGAEGADDRRAQLVADLTSVRRRLAELFSTHPSTGRRILALERSQLPGAPRSWNLAEAAAAARLRWRWSRQAR